MYSVGRTAEICTECSDLEVGFGFVGGLGRLEVACVFGRMLGRLEAACDVVAIEELGLLEATSGFGGRSGVLEATSDFVIMFRGRGKASLGLGLGIRLISVLYTACVVMILCC